MSDKMNDKEKMFYAALLDAYKTSDYVTTKMMVKKAKLPDSTTRRYLAKFCDMGIIISDGKNKGTKYYLQ